MTVALVILTLVVASFIQSVVGFGAALVGAPILLTFLDRPTAFSSLLAGGTVLSAFLVRRISGPVSARVVVRLVVTALVGMPIGLLILIHMPIGPFRIVVGILAIGLACLTFRGRSAPATRASLALAGVSSGILHTTTTMSGPPVVLLLTRSDMGRDEIRRTLQLYYVCLSLVSLPLFFSASLLNGRGAALGVASVPFVVAAGYAGNLTARFISRERFRVLALAVVVAAGAVSIASSLRSG